MLEELDDAALFILHAGIVIAHFAELHEGRAIGVGFFVLLIAIAADSADAREEYKKWKHIRAVKHGEEVPE